jgi:hypothetical protein
MHREHWWDDEIEMHGNRWPCFRSRRWGLFFVPIQQFQEKEYQVVQKYSVFPPWVIG